MTGLPAQDYAETRLVPLSQLQPAPWNPRMIRDARFRALCASLTLDPAFLWDNPVCANAAGIIFRGNMRYRAAQHLGWAAIPARTYPIADADAQRRALVDNNHAGEWDEPALGELLVDLQGTGLALETLGFPDEQLAGLLDSTGVLGDLGPDPGFGAPTPLPQWQTCPACGHRWLDGDADA
jgi:ParB-like chromosome segregation protein Spo0J